MEPRECPKRGLLNLEDVSLCHCGHRFVSDALLQWVRDSQRAGQSQEQILQQLVYGGYTPEDVQAVLGEAAVRMDRGQQSSTDAGVAVGIIAVLAGVVVIVLIVVVLLLILAWYLIYGKTPSPPPPQMQQQIEGIDRPRGEEPGEEQGQTEESEEEQEQLEQPGSSISPSGLMVPEGPTKGPATMCREHLWRQ